MRWFSFAILAVIALVLQTTVVPRMEIQLIRPDLVFILAVHYALWGPWPDAAIAAWILGFIASLQSADPVGIQAFAFGLAAWCILRIRQVLFRDHAMTQLLLTLCFMFAIQLIIGLYRRWAMAPAEGGFVWPALMTAVYTGACAPYLHWVLIRLSWLTGLRTSRGLLSPQ